MDEDFVAALRTLASKLAFADNDPQAQSSAALRDVIPELEKLRAKAAARSRDFLLQRIYSLRKDKTNIQILQQNVLLRYRYLVAFLQAHGREVFEEVRTAYVDTLSRVLASKFRAYINATDKLLVRDDAQYVVSSGIRTPRHADDRRAHPGRFAGQPRCGARGSDGHV